MSTRRSRRRAFTCACLWIVLAAVVAPAATVATRQSDTPDKPDFSGRWHLVSPSAPDADVPRALSVRQSVNQTTARGEPMPAAFSAIAIHRQLASGTRSESRQIGIAGGTVGGIPADSRTRGSSSYHRVVWESRALIFEDESRDAGSWTERREIWAMDPDGRLRVVLTTRGSDRPARSLTLIYRRE